MRPMDQAARFHETLRRLAIIDEGLAECQAGLGLGPGGDIGPRPSLRHVLSRSCWC